MVLLISLLIIGGTLFLLSIRQLTDANVLTPEQTANLTEAFGAFCIAASEKKID